MVHKENPDIKRMKGEIEAARRQARKTLGDIRNKIKYEGEMVKFTLKDVLIQTVEKMDRFRNRPKAVLGKTKPQNLQKNRDGYSAGIYMGAGLIAAGLVLIAVSAKRRRDKISDRIALLETAGYVQEKIPEIEPEVFEEEVLEGVRRHGMMDSPVI
ncbi:MAG: hypothetical protein R6U50_05380 [Desulfobacterales bacterium]